MKKPIIFLILTMMLLVGGLTACNRGTPRCTEMPASWLITGPWVPLDWDEPGTPVTLQWYYPGTCLPDYFRIAINDTPYLGGDILDQEDVLVSGPYARTVFEDGTTAISFSWTTEETFVDGWYYWWVIPYSGEYRGEISPSSIFNIYTFWGRPWWCPEENWRLEVLPELVYPANGSVIHTLNPSLAWRDRNPQITRCSVWGSWYGILYSQETDDLDLAEIRFAQSPEAVSDWWGSNTDLWTDDWILPAGIYLVEKYNGKGVSISLTECRRTYWQVNLSILLSNSTSVVWPSETHYFDVDPALCLVESLPFIEIPYAPPSAPMAKTLESANCRSGPTLDYPMLSVLPAGGEYEIQARNTPGDSWMVFDPAINDTCWVFADLVELFGDTGLVMIIDPDPPPLVMPTETTETVDCSQYNTDPNACNANPACWWDSSVPPNGVCKNK
ncbi:MAG: hypothetical protein AB1531_12740 [Chloroflexota bacterium]